MVENAFTRVSAARVKQKQFVWPTIMTTEKKIQRKMVYGGRGRKGRIPNPFGKSSVPQKCQQFINRNFLLSCKTINNLRCTNTCTRKPLAPWLNQLVLEAAISCTC